ncbi:MAG TPA: winged helix DNA-binding domain-containing protein [Thermoplasmata archaeon]|nr:winged helix DNA-binding domain-containing protein [Thermoplasmata archaeon]
MRPERHPAAEAKVAWEQVRAFRLSRHHLSRRAPVEELTRVVGDMGGAQAQLTSAAQLSIWARVRDVRITDLEAAVGAERTLARAWCMRRTVHLVPSAELAVFVRGSARRAEKEVRWVRGRGFPQHTIEELLATVLSVLDEPRTRPEIAERVARSLGRKTRTLRGGGWGNRRPMQGVAIGKITFPAEYLLHLAGARGVVCSGPDRGAESTFVRADVWIPGYRDMPGPQAEAALLRRYLRASGPATPADFALWSGLRLRDAREVWSRVESDIATIDVEGWSAGVLRADLNDLENAEFQPPSVRLLPNFDSFLIRHTERSHLVEPRHHGRVFRPQGWVSPVLLIEGRTAGVWKAERTANRLLVRVEPFAPLSRGVRRGLDAEAREMGRFLGVPGVQVAIA